MRPPWASTSRRVRARPRPVPCVRWADVADLLELLEDDARSSAAMPDPGVGDGDAHAVRRRPRRDTVMRPPAGVNLMAFESRLYMIWRKRPRSASAMSPAGTSESIELALVVGQRLEAGQRLATAARRRSARDRGRAGRPRPWPGRGRR